MNSYNVSCLLRDVKTRLWRKTERYGQGKSYVTHQRNQVKFRMIFREVRTTFHHRMFSYARYCIYVFRNNPTQFIIVCLNVPPCQERFETYSKHVEFSSTKHNYRLNRFCDVPLKRRINTSIVRANTIKQVWRGSANISVHMCGILTGTVLKPWCRDRSGSSNHTSTARGCHATIVTWRSNKGRDQGGSKGQTSRINPPTIRGIRMVSVICYCVEIRGRAAVSRRFTLCFRPVEDRHCSTLARNARRGFPFDFRLPFRRLVSLNVINFRPFRRTREAMISYISERWFKRSQSCEKYRGVCWEQRQTKTR